MTFRQLEIFLEAAGEREHNDFVRQARLHGSEAEMIGPPMDDEEKVQAGIDDEAIKARMQKAMARGNVAMRGQGGDRRRNRPDNRSQREN